MNPAKTYGNSLGRFVAYSSEYLNFLHLRLNEAARAADATRLYWSALVPSRTTLRGFLIAIRMSVMYCGFETFSLLFRSARKSLFGISLQFKSHTMPRPPQARAASFKRLYRK